MTDKFNILDTPPAGSDATLAFTDITTNDSSTTKHGFLKKLDNTSTNYMSGTGVWSAPAGGGGAPTTATYITQTADATLSAEQAMGALATGLVKNTTTTGVQSIAAAGTDYQAPILMVVVRDEKTQNTAGGTFTSGAWRTRTLNTLVTNQGSIASLSSNQLTLPAGTYRIDARAPGYSCNEHQLRWQNITDTATTLIGDVALAYDAGFVQASATLVGVFTIAGSKAFELQNICSTTKATNGFGVQGNFTTEVYAVVALEKIA